MWTQKEMVSRAFKLCAQAFRMIVIFILMQLVYLFKEFTFGDFLLTAPWVKIWWHALRLASAFQSSYRAGIPKEFSPGTLNNSGRRLLARLRTTHWPSKSDLLTLINDQFLMLSCHIDEEGHQKTIHWSIGIISFPWSPINIQSCYNLYTNGLLSLYKYMQVPIYLQKVIAQVQLCMDHSCLTFWKPQIVLRIWVVVSGWHMVHSLPGN